MGIGKITAGKEGTADTTFIILDEDFLQLAAGKLNAQSAFMTVMNELVFMCICIGQDEDKGKHG